MRNLRKKAYEHYYPEFKKRIETMIVKLIVMNKRSVGVIARYVIDELNIVFKYGEINIDIPDEFKTELMNLFVDYYIAHHNIVGVDVSICTTFDYVKCMCHATTRVKCGLKSGSDCEICAERICKRYIHRTRYKDIMLNIVLE